MDLIKFKELTEVLERLAFKYLSGQGISRSDELTVVVRGHLLVEAAMNAILEMKFTNDCFLKKGRVTFAAKMRLCRSLGIMKEDVYSAIKQLNDIRNDFAHILHADLDVKKMDILFQILERDPHGMTALKTAPDDRKALLGLSVHVIINRFLQDIL